MKCPFKKIITKERMLNGEEKTKIEFGECDGKDCKAHNNYRSTCRLLPNEVKS